MKYAIIKYVIVVQQNGVYYIYVNGDFYCSCDSFAEVREEINKI